MCKLSRYLVAALGVMVMASGHQSAFADEALNVSFPSYSTETLISNFAAPDITREMLAERKVSASEAKSIALSQVGGGEVVDISRKGDTYRVRVIAKNGRVVDVYIDATTGRVKR